MRSAFDGRRLVLVGSHTGTTVLAVLLVLAGASGSVAVFVVVPVVGGGGAVPTVLGVTLAAALLAALVTVVVRKVRRYPRPTLQVTPDGVDVRAYGERWQVPWADVRSVGRRQSPLGDFYFAVDVAPEYWERVGRRWHEQTKGGLHGGVDDVSDLITFQVRGMTLRQALLHTRRVAPAAVRVDAS